MNIDNIMKLIRTVQDEAWNDCKLGYTNESERVTAAVTDLRAAIEQALEPTPEQMLAKGWQPIKCPVCGDSTAVAPKVGVKEWEVHALRAGWSPKPQEAARVLEAVEKLRAILCDPEPAHQGGEMNYTTNPRNLLPNGLTLLQVNPDCAAQLDPEAKDFGWLYIKGADNQWVTLRKLPPTEIEVAQDQAADMVVLQGTKVRAG